MNIKPDNRNTIHIEPLFGNTIRIRILIIVILMGMIIQSCRVQSGRLLKKANEASVQFAKKASAGTAYQFSPDTVIVDHLTKSITLRMKESFSYLPFRPEDKFQFYSWYHELLGRKFRNYSITIESMGKEISELIPNYYRGNSVKIDSSRLVKSKKIKY